MDEHHLQFTEGQTERKYNQKEIQNKTGLFPRRGHGKFKILYVHRHIFLDIAGAYSHGNGLLPAAV